MSKMIAGLVIALAVLLTGCDPNLDGNDDGLFDGKSDCEYSGKCGFGG